MQPEDVERKLRGESLGKLKQKTSVSCKMLLEVWDSYVEHFYDGVQPPLILDGAVSEDETPTAADIQKHEELVAVYRQLAQNAPLA